MASIKILEDAKNKTETYFISHKGIMKPIEVWGGFQSRFAEKRLGNVSLTCYSLDGNPNGILITGENPSNPEQIGLLEMACQGQAIKIKEQIKYFVLIHGGNPEKITWRFD